MIKNVLIKDIVKKDNITINKDLSISDAIDLMYKNREGTVIVLDGDTVVGILTERDLVKLLNRKTNINQKVINVAKKNVISININRTLEYALNVLTDHHIRRVVITDNDYKFIGLATQEMIVSSFETEYYREDLKVWQIASSLGNDIVSIEMDRALEDVVESMYNNKIGSILISDNKEIVGIVTERDLVYLASKRTAPSTPIKEVMHSPVISVRLDDSVKDTVNMMASEAIRRVLVKDLSGNNLCIMGTRDIIKSLKGTFGVFIETKLKYTKQALNSIDEVIFELYSDSKIGLLIQWGNESTLDRYGTDIIDKPITTLIAKDKLDLLLDKLDKFTQVSDYELDIGEYNYKISINANHNSDSILMICKDITKIIELKNEVKEQQIIFENIFQKSSDGILLVEDKRIIDCNESVLKMFEYGSKSELLDLHPASLCLKDNLDSQFTFEKANEIILLIFKNGYYTFECVKSKKNGENLWIDIVGTKIVQNGKDILHIVFRDISNRKKAEYELEQLNKDLRNRVDKEVEKNRKQDQLILKQSRLAQMGEMISMIAHQWRQPLNALTMLNQAVVLKYKRGKLDTDLIDYFSKNSDRQIQQMSKTIDDFRDFFKPEKENVDYCINDVIVHCINMLNTVFSKYDLLIEYDNTQTIYSNGFPNELGQSLINIFNNAKDALVDNEIADKVIIVDLEQKDDKAIITIRDNAGGIPDDIIDKIFDPYFSTKEGKNGTGLGLYMTKLIIEDHLNGQISVENIDDGAEFTITLKEMKD